MLQTLRKAVIAAWAMGIFAASIWGQTYSAVTGVITDPGGGAVGEAAVTVTNVDTGIAIESPTNDQGYYTFPRLSTDPANTGTSKRPNRIASGALPDPSINLWFDPKAFLVPAPYTYGNSARNILYSPGFRNWDAVVMRIFPIRERLRLQFRGEFFNFTNTPPFNGPVTNIQASNVGHIISAGSPRDIQLALKLLF